jgi:hypothetical protein
MARPASWLPRLHGIHRTVSNSVRSHYDRRDLEQLFELQPRAAQKLLSLLPTVAVGTSRLVEREALGSFLDGARDANDITAYFERVRTQASASSRKRLRTLVRRDVEPLQLDSLPANIEFIPGQMIVSFRTIEDLAQAMYSLARAIETDGDELAKRYEVHEVADDGSPNRSEFEAMMQELSTLEANRSSSSATPLQRPTAS